MKPLLAFDRNIGILIGVQVCVIGCMAGIRMAAPLLLLRQGYGTTTVGCLLALFSFIQLFLAIPAGRFADRHGLKTPVMLCMACAAVGAALASLWPVLPVICVAALLNGAATGGVMITLQRHAGRLASEPTQLRQIFSWLAVAPSIANFVGPFVSGVVIDYVGFSASFAVMGGLALLSWPMVRHSPELVKESVETSHAASNRSWELLADPRLRQLLFINWIMMSCRDVHTFVLPLLGHERGISASVIGGILGAFAIAATVVRLFLPVVAARIQEWAVIAVAMVAAVVLYGIYPLVSSPLLMGVCSVLLGLFLGAVQPMIMSSLHQITPPHRQGEALALRLMSVNMSSILMPVAFGSLGAAIGVAKVFWSISAIVACGLRSAINLRRSQTAHDD